MEEASDISDLISVLNGRGITDADRMRRLKSYLTSTRLSAAQGISLVEIFDRVCVLVYMSPCLRCYYFS